ncbi:MAG: 4Fe-4S dicluster domain-containing protein [Halanaerobiales bacterium]|nr:4Fe-4S dicluster domain-containing protein [Halanaerobiales bacterium]
MLNIEKLKKVSKNMGVKYFGVADLSTAYHEILKQGGSDVAKYPYAISIGIVLPNSIIERLTKRNEKEVIIDYMSHSYDIINQRLDNITSLLGSLIQAEGYDVLPILAGKKVSQVRLSGSFSHKLAANLAGLGWIGKSCLLITPEDGPRVRWATVLTDAPLEIKNKLMDNRCGECNKCVDICPVGAFTGREFKEDEPRDKRYIAEKCDQYLSMKREPIKICGMCIYICPYGKKN